MDSASISTPHMSESDVTNIAVSGFTTVKVTKCKGAKALYHKYQRR